MNALAPPTSPAPPISVVIPAYQAARFIGDAIASVLSQDVAPSELIVVDDGSTDDTASVAAEFGSRVTVVRKTHLGEAATRNAGLRAATSDWVMFLDADDTFLPGRLRAVGNVLPSDPTFDAVTTDAWFRQGGVRVRRCYEDDFPFEFAHQRIEILRRNFVFGHVTANRARLLALGGYDESIGYACDWAMWIRLLLAGGRIGLVPEPLSVYRYHAGSMSADQVALERGCIAIFEGVRDNPDLLPAERPIVEETLREHRLKLDGAELSASLATGNGVRASALAVARSRDHPPRLRAKAAVGVLAPSIVSRLVRRRRRGLVKITNGHLVPAEFANEPG